VTGAVLGVGAWRGAGLPRPLESGELRRLLSCCDRRTVVGRRDFAIVLLMGRLGLRCGEVARLTLEDIDWRAGLVVEGSVRLAQGRLGLGEDTTYPPPGELGRNPLGRAMGASEGMDQRTFSDGRLGRRAPVQRVSNAERCLRRVRVRLATCRCARRGCFRSDLAAASGRWANTRPGRERHRRALRGCTELIGLLAAGAPAEHAWCSARSAHSCRSSRSRSNATGSRSHRARTPRNPARRSWCWPDVTCPSRSECHRGWCWASARVCRELPGRRRPDPARGRRRARPSRRISFALTGGGVGLPG
jgi:hypothetical protein